MYKRPKKNTGFSGGGPRNNVGRETGVYGRVYGSGESTVGESSEKNQVMCFQSNSSSDVESAR